MSEIKQATLIPVGEIDLPFVDINPNKLSDSKFNRLVEQIKENGFQDPVKVYKGEDGRYKLFAGEHRYQAAKVIGMVEVPAFVEEYEEDKAKFELFKDNFFRGEVDSGKFTKLYNEMSSKYGEATKELFRISDTEFEKLYKEVKKALPKDLQAKLDKAKEEIKSIEDLSSILNRLFSSYGDTLQFNFMIIDYGGKESLWVRIPEDRWQQAKMFAEWCKNQKLDMSQFVDGGKVLDEILANVEEYKNKQLSETKGE